MGRNNRYNLNQQLLLFFFFFLILQNSNEASTDAQTEQHKPRDHANRWYTNGDGVAGSTCLFFTFTCHWDTTLVDWDQI